MSNLLVPAVIAFGLYKWCCHVPALVPGQKSLTFYYMASCHHCRNMYPEMRKLGNNYKGVVIRWVEESSNREYTVNAFPTLVYRSADGVVEQYDGARNSSALKAFLDSK